MSAQGPGANPADPLIDEVRQRRRDLLAACGDDLLRLAEAIRRREREHPELMVDPRESGAKRAGEDDRQA